MAFSGRSLLWLSIASCLQFGGCAIKRDEYDVPVAPLPAQFKNAELPKPAGAEPVSQSVQPISKQLLGGLLNEWWYCLENEELNHLVDQALANNHDLRIAMLRIAQSHARAEQAFAKQFPEISAIGQGHHDSPSNGINSFSGFGNQLDRQYAQIGPRGDWRADIWGELKSQAESAELEAWGATYQRDDIRRLLIANVVSRYIEYLSLNDRVQVGIKTKEAMDALLKAVEDRMKLGDATIMDYEQQRAAVMSVQATIPGLELQRENVANALAQLLGVTPGSLHLSEQGLDTLKFPEVEPVVPAELLLRRPDVRAVEARLIAADANIDVARARVLPPLDITAQAGWGILALGSMSTPYGPLFNVAANLSATIFDYGKRMQEVDFARAMHEELVETYMRVIYSAVKETEDALANTFMNGKRLEAQRQSAAAAEQALSYSPTLFELGDIDYLTVLDTQRTYHRNQDEYHRVRMDRYLGLVQVFSALGGGVPTGERLPGDGQRPQTQQAQVQLDRHGLPNAGILWDEPESNEDFWLVQLAGLQDPLGVGHVWRDLQQRFPELMQQRVLMPREVGHIQKDEQERTRWYRVFVAHFQDEAEAQNFCQQLQTQLLRCHALSSDDSEFTRLEAVKPKQAADTQNQSVQSPAIVTPAAVATSTQPAPESVQPIVETPPPIQAEPIAANAPLPAQSGESAGSYLEAYAVQISTLTSEQDAQQELQLKQHQGLEVYLYPITASNGKVLYTLRTGIYPDKATASQQARLLDGQLNMHTIPVGIRLDAAGRPAPLALPVQAGSGHD